MIIRLGRIVLLICLFFDMVWFDFDLIVYGQVCIMFYFILIIVDLFYLCLWLFCFIFGLIVN